jgi:hypothetical protein
MGVCSRRSEHAQQARGGSGDRPNGNAENRTGNRSTFAPLGWNLDLFLSLPVKPYHDPECGNGSRLSGCVREKRKVKHFDGFRTI